MKLVMFAAGFGAIIGHYLWAFMVSSDFNMALERSYYSVFPLIAPFLYASMMKANQP